MNIFKKLKDILIVLFFYIFFFLCVAGFMAGNGFINRKLIAIVHYIYGTIIGIALIKIKEVLK